jgi:hypothetical protein
MMAYNTITETFDGIAVQHMNCWCGIAFAIPMTLYEHYVRENDSRNRYNLFCPLGHSMIPAGKSESDKLRDQLAAEKHAREQAQAHGRFLSQRLTEVYDEKTHVEHRLRGTKAVITRMKRRAVAGRCPCCSHQFKDLERHMKTQHPKFDPEKGADALAGEK